MSHLVKPKDSQWLQLEICREFQRSKCPKLDCRFAHPPQNVDVVEGKVMSCYDSFKGRCTRESCKYFHPPSHLMDQLMMKGRNNLAFKNAIVQHVPMIPTMGLMPFPADVSSILMSPEHSGPSTLVNKIETGAKRSADAPEMMLESFYPTAFCKRARPYTPTEYIPFPFIPSVPYQPVFQFPPPAERKFSTICQLLAPCSLMTNNFFAFSAGAFASQKP